jgi:hypothetical protein
MVEYDSRPSITRPYSALHVHDRPSTSNFAGDSPSIRGWPSLNFALKKKALGRAQPKLVHESPLKYIYICIRELLYFEPHVIRTFCRFQPSLQIFLY